MKKILTTLVFFLSLFNLSAQQCTLLEIGPDETLNCLNNCTTLEAHFMGGFGDPLDTYTIQNNTPCPLPPVTNGTPTTISTDDDWSSLITIPFDFKFFGNTYNQLIIGDNGVVSFDTNRSSPQIQKPNDFCEWSFNSTLPNTGMFRNTIFGAYHDLYIPAGGTIEYYTSGNAPERIFVISFDNVAHYSCNSYKTTQRILLYETTNIIDVQITRKDLCRSWNNGNAVVGIQNEDGTVAYVPPGRNTSAWGVSHEELWRFIPDTSNIIPHTTTWYDANTNTVLGTGDTFQLCITNDMDIRCEVDYLDFGSIPRTLVDTKHITFDGTHDDVDLGADITKCQNDVVTLDGTVANATGYQWQLNGIDIPGATNPTLDVTDAGTYTVLVDIGVCSTSDNVLVTNIAAPTVTLPPDYHFCEGNTQTLTVDVSPNTGQETYQWYKDGNPIANATTDHIEVTDSGTYSVEVTNSTGCTSTTQTILTKDPYPDLDLGEDQVVCAYNTAVVAASILDGDNYEWIVNNNIVNNNSPVLELNGPGQYDVRLNLDRGTCSVTDSTHVQILDPVTVVTTPVLYGELEVTVTDGGLPPYQYSVDGVNFQNDNYFKNLADGDYSVSIKDDNGCVYNDVAMTHVINLLVMQFFTPNGDGYNDAWRIGNAENTPGAQLNVYDRYGKLVRSMHTTSQETWDGTLNGMVLPASDYWFILTLPNGKVYKGHFALKR